METTRRLPLGNSRFTIVDNDDFENLKLYEYKWSSSKQHRTSYVFRKTPGNPTKDIKLHRLITNCPKDMQVDHINGNGLDNRKENLRICTHLQNHWNLKKPIRKSLIRQSSYKGVSWDGTNKKWRAVIKHNNKGIWLGRFPNEIEAAKAYDKKAIELFGKFAKINLPD